VDSDGWTTGGTTSTSSVAVVDSDGDSGGWSGKGGGWNVVDVLSWADSDHGGDSSASWVATGHDGSRLTIWTVED